MTKKIDQTLWKLAAYQYLRFDQGKYDKPFKDLEGHQKITCNVEGEKAQKIFEYMMAIKGKWLERKK